MLTREDLLHVQSSIRI